jgi:hypothetical protein
MTAEDRAARAAAGGRSPLALRDLARHLDPDAEGAGDAVEVPVPHAPGEDGDPRYATLVGLFDAIVEASCRELPTDARRREALADALARVEALVPVLRFELQELRERLRQDELVARARDREIRMTDGWLIPRLHRDIRAYEDRIRALLAALGKAT